jgi:hypothetical protein
MVLWLVRRLDAELRTTTNHASRGWLHLRIRRSITSAGVSTLAFIIKLATTPNIASVLVEQWPIPGYAYVARCKVCVQDLVFLILSLRVIV